MAIGFGVTFSLPATIGILHSAQTAEAGVAAGAFNTSRQVGSLIGVAIFGTIINTSGHFISGMKTAFLFGGVAFFIGLMITLFWIDLKT
jgi:MFS transporter, DHA2 family, methylenomycin A resistance protein